MGYSTYQLDDLDKHPVVGRSRQELEQLRGKGEVVLWVPTRQLANHIHGSRDDRYYKPNINN